MPSLIYGSDIFRAREYINQQINQLVNTNQHIPIEKIDGQTIDPVKLSTTLEPAQLFATQKIIILKNILSTKNKKSIDILKNFMSNPDPNIYLFVWEQSDIDKRSWLYKYFHKKSKTQTLISQQFSPLPKNQLISWIKQYCANQNIHIDPDAIFDLVEKNQNTFWLSLEIDKLKHYSNNNITKKDIDKLSPTNPQDIIFDLTDQIGNKRQKQAHQTAKNLIQKGEDPFKILATLATHIQNLLIIKDLQNKKQTPAQIKEKSSLHPFVIQKCEQQARNFDIKELAIIYTNIANADINLKNGQSDFNREIFNIIFNL